MSKFEELLISFETCCTALAEEEFDKSVENLADAESARIEGGTLFKQYFGRCKDLAGSDYIYARYCPNLETLAKHGTRGIQPAQEELEEAKVDLATIEFYRQMFGPDAVGDSSAEQAYPDWQTALVDIFETRDRYLQAIEPIARAHKNSMQATGGLDSYVSVLLKIANACQRARQRMFDMGALVGRYEISSELWEQEGGAYRFKKSVELNRPLGRPNRRPGFVHINGDGDLVHSYRSASTIKNSNGETITSRVEDANPVLLVPHTYADSLARPSAVALIDFGKHHSCRLEIVFQSKATYRESGGS
ncbi:MAG: hypothetical protein CEE38_16240 [Planctomycetes bacterium B3_Pla]|nr:MAG: hypothetical protein CEE38_16240 [Planctomycetes bacterium B3_Pla]